MDSYDETINKYYNERIAISESSNLLTGGGEKISEAPRILEKNFDAKRNSSSS